MGKYFNTTGICYPEDHYMVNIESRLQKIEKLIGRGEYFMIHKARTRNMRRADVIVDYPGKQYVCELKIWQGKEYNKRCEKHSIKKNPPAFP